MRKIVFSSQKYSELDVFIARGSEENRTEVVLSSSDCEKTLASEKERSHFHLFLERNSSYEFCWNTGNVTFAYLSGNDDIEREGIKILYPIKEYEYRNKIHFSPAAGWMNDPNGLSVLNGRIHMFYQFSPYAQVWGNMHWGHAVSDDLVHWAHLPIAFYPQPEIDDYHRFRGGAFSGSILAENDVMKAYFTRNFGAADRSWKHEWQVSATSTDTIHFTGEHIVLEPDQKGVYADFRDPKIFRMDGRYYLVVAGMQEKTPTVFLYSSEDGENWDFSTTLLREDGNRYGSAECPDFFFLDGKWVVIAGFHNAVMKTPNLRDVRYYIGSFDGKSFKAETTGLLDYGYDFYAFQSFEYKGRRLCFGWNPDSYQLHRPLEGGVNGSQSLPRELHVEDGKLVQLPVSEIDTLLDENSNVSIPCKVEISSAAGSFEKELVSSTEGSVLLRYRDGRLQLEVAGKQRFDIELTIQKDIVAYIDTAIVEIFTADGLFAATSRYYFENARPVESDRYTRVTAMSSIWR